MAEAHQFLRELYERCPHMWKVDKWFDDANRWEEIKHLGAPAWNSYSRYRLRPIMPEGLPTPPIETFPMDLDHRGAFPLGWGKTFKCPNSLIQGWYYTKDAAGWTFAYNMAAIHAPQYYLLDLRDPKSDTIIENALSEARQTWRCHKTSISEVIAQSIAHALDSNEGIIHRKLVEMGWTPPGGDFDWVTLEDCDFQISDGKLEDGGFLWGELSAPDEDDLAIHALRYGPGSVRVRPRKKS